MIRRGGAGWVKWIVLLHPFVLFVMLPKVPCRASRGMLHPKERRREVDARTLSVEWLVGVRGVLGLLEDGGCGQAESNATMFAQTRYMQEALPCESGCA